MFVIGWYLCTLSNIRQPPPLLLLLHVPINKIDSAANYLNIKPLLDLTVLAVSILIKGKSAAELREIFNVTGEGAAEEGEGAAAEAES